MPDKLKPLSFFYQQALAPLVARTEDAGMARRLSELLTLLDFNSTLNRSLALADILDLVLLIAMGETQAGWVTVGLSNDQGRIRAAASRGRRTQDWDGVDRETLEELGGTVAPTDSDLPPGAKRLLASSGAALAVPLLKGDGLLGVLLLGRGSQEYSHGERAFVEALAISAAASIDNCRVYGELRDLNRKLNLRIYQLNSLFDITHELNGALDAPRVREILVVSAMGQVLATRCVLVQPEGGVDVRGLTLGSDELELLRRDGVRLQERTGPISVDTLDSGRLKEFLRSNELESALPLRYGTSAHGVLFVGRKATGQPLREEDIDFLRSLAAQGAAALDNLRLTREWVEKQKIERELAVARQIQRGLLPNEEPSLPGWDIAGVNIPCLAVGGDYYDYLKGSGGRLGLVVADVSGKGTGPALLMASIQASLRVLSGMDGLSLDRLLVRLNAMVHSNTEANQYVTLFLGWLDPENGTLVYSNSGHCYPLVFRRTGDIARLVEGSPVIGLLPRVEVELGRVDLGPSDMLVLYTDGLSETVSPTGEEFAEARIVETVQSSASRSARDLVGGLVSSVRIFAAEAGLRDDLTLMVVKRT